MLCDNFKQVDEGCKSKNTFPLFSIPPEQFTALAALIGFLLADDLSIDEQNSLGNFLIAIGQILVTIASQKAVFESQQDNQLITQRLDFLKKQIRDIEQEIERTSKNGS